MATPIPRSLKPLILWTLLPNLKSLENGGKDGSTGPSTSTTTNTTTINNVPGQDGGVKATKNLMVQLPSHFPDGSTQTVQPGDKTKP